MTNGFFTQRSKVNQLFIHETQYSFPLFIAVSDATVNLTINSTSDISSNRSIHGDVINSNLIIMIHTNGGDNYTGKVSYIVNGY